MGAAYFGLLAAAALLIGCAWYGYLRKRMPWELVATVVLLAVALIVAGVLLGNRWSITGTLMAPSPVPRSEAETVLMLGVSSTYLSEIDVPTSYAILLKEGLHLEETQEGCAIDYAYSGFTSDAAASQRTAIKTFLENLSRDLEGVLFAARLLLARTHEDLARLLEGRGPIMGKPVRVLIRSLLQELHDRFPSSQALLDELKRRVGA